MGHEADLIQVLLALTIVILASLITYALYQRKKNTGIEALNLLIYIFASLALLGFVEFTQTLFHQYISFYPTEESTVPLILSPVRLVNILLILMLYVFAENIMEQRVHIARFSILLVLLSGIFFVGIASIATGELIRVNQITGFGSTTRFSEFLFDLLQLYVISFVTYVYWEQYRFTESKQYKKYFRLFVLATILFMSALLYEVLENLIALPDISAFMTGFPAFILISYVYLKHPNMIYLVPTDIRFLQLVTIDSGIPVYVAEFSRDQETMDYLVGPGLSSIRTMLGELLKSKSDFSSDFSLKSFEYNNGYLIFEENSKLFALLQTNRLSKILLTSLGYFIKKFYETFGPQITNYKGKIQPVNGLRPDDILKMCIPIVQARPILSSIEIQ